MIRRGYSPPYQAKAPQLGADDIGRTIKGLVNVEVARTNEVTFAVESFGCDGKPVLSPMRGLGCEVPGKLVVAGTKGGMPFKLGAELPRGIGSAIRGSGGGMVTVSGGRALRTDEWVLFDNFGNHWSLDTLVDGYLPTYLGETPPEAGETTPALCTMDPRIRPYQKRWEYIAPGGDIGGPYAWWHAAGAGWTEDDLPGVVWVSPVTFADPWVQPADYWRIEQYIPDETTPPTGASLSAHWPTSKRRVEVEWWPGNADTPVTWAGEGANSIDVLMAQYGTTPPFNYFANQFTRPLIEHVSIGATTNEDRFAICLEEMRYPAPTVYRIALRGRTTGALIASLAITPRSDARHFFTPNKTEGWLFQTGAILGGDTVVVKPYLSRTNPANAYGSGLKSDTWLSVTLPEGAAHTWDAEPVWFRVGKVSSWMGGTPWLTPLLPKWS